MTKETKKRITFALTMGIITTGIISFSLISINLGFSDKFLYIWLKSWMMGYLIAVPAIIFIGPKIQYVIDRSFE